MHTSIICDSKDTEVLGSGNTHEHGWVTVLDGRGGSVLLYGEDPDVLMKIGECCTEVATAWRLRIETEAATSDPQPDDYQFGLHT